jgi:pimeloyl-ACP methyl ester carboxylesterase
VSPSRVDRTIDGGYDALVRPTGQGEVVMGSDPFIASASGQPDTGASTGRECIAFDWPGLGHSAPVGGSAGPGLGHSAPLAAGSAVDGDASPQALAEHLRAVLDALGLDRVDLLAGDMGAPPALVFAATYPERVRRVTCTSSLLFHDAETSIEISIMRRANLAGAAFSLAPKVVYRRSKQSMLDGGLPAAIDRDFWTAFAKKSVRDRLARMCIDYERALPDLPSIYWKLRCPVHLIWAEHDRHFAVEHAERLCAIVPTAKLDVIAGAKHWMALERPGELAVYL